MAFTEDMSVFLNTDDFAVTATYDGSTTINGIYDAAYIDVNGVGSVNPVFLCAASDVAGDPTGKAIVVNGVNYVIRNIEPQGDGALVILQLEEQ